MGWPVSWNDVEKAIKPDLVIDVSSANGVKPALSDITIAYGDVLDVRNSIIAGNAVNITIRHTESDEVYAEANVYSAIASVYSGCLSVIYTTSMVGNRIYKFIIYFDEDGAVADIRAYVFSGEEQD